MKKNSFFIAFLLVTTAALSCAATAFLIKRFPAQKSFVTENECGNKKLSLNYDTPWRAATSPYLEDLRCYKIPIPHKEFNEINVQNVEEVARTGESAMPIPGQPSEETLPADEVGEEDPMERWRLMQEERLRQQGMLTQARPPQPEGPPPPVERYTLADFKLSDSEGSERIYDLLRVSDLDTEPLIEKEVRKAKLHPEEIFELAEAALSYNKWAAAIEILKAGLLNQTDAVTIEYGNYELRKLAGKATEAVRDGQVDGAIILILLNEYNISAVARMNILLDYAEKAPRDDQVLPHLMDKITSLELAKNVGENDLNNFTSTLEVLFEIIATDYKGGPAEKESAFISALQIGEISPSAFFNAAHLNLLEEDDYNLLASILQKSTQYQKSEFLEYNKDKLPEIYSNIMYAYWKEKNCNFMELRGNIIPINDWERILVDLQTYYKTSLKTQLKDCSVTE